MTARVLTWIRVERLPEGASLDGEPIEFAPVIEPLGMSSGDQLIQGDLGGPTATPQHGLHGAEAEERTIVPLADDLLGFFRQTDPRGCWCAEHTDA